MKKASFSVLLATVILTACAQGQIHFADPVDVEKALTESETLAAEVAAEKIDTVAVAPKPTPAQTVKPEPTPEPTSAPTPAAEPEAEPTVDPEQVPVTAPQPEPAPEPTSEPVSPPTYGAVPFELTAGTDKWWKIDDTDSAYWAMQEQINAVRAAGGLPALACVEDMPSLGKYGMLRRSYLRQHHSGTYTGMLLSGKLHPHLQEVDRQANEMGERLITQMAWQQNVTEEMKASDQLRWVGMMNNIRAAAEEIILNELIYT